MMSVSKLQKKADVDAIIAIYNHVTNKQIELIMSCVMHRTYIYCSHCCLNSCNYN